MPRVSLEFKPTATASRVDTSRPLVPVALGTALVLVTYVTPIATIPATAADLGAGPVARAWILSSMSVGLAGLLLASGVIGDALRSSAGVRRRAGRHRRSAPCCARCRWSRCCSWSAASSRAAVAPPCWRAGWRCWRTATRWGRTGSSATSVWGASVGLGIVAGAVLSALLDFGSGWRPSLWVTAAARARAGRRRACGWMAESSAAVRHRVDVAGLALLVAAMTLAVSALTQGRNGIDLPTVVLAVLAVLSLAAFVLVERRVAAPLLDPELLAHPRFRAATGRLTGARRRNDRHGVVHPDAGAGRLRARALGGHPAGVRLGRHGVVTSMLVRRIPHPLEGPRPVALFLVVVAVGQLLTYGLDAGSPCGGSAVPFVVAGAATGVLNSLLGREAIASVPPDRAAMGSRRQQHRPLPRRRLRHHAVRDRRDAHRRRPVRRLERRRAGRRRAHPARGRRDRGDRARAPARALASGRDDAGRTAVRQEARARGPCRSGSSRCCAWSTAWRTTCGSRRSQAPPRRSPFRSWCGAGGGRASGEP